MPWRIRQPQSNKPPTSPARQHVTKIVTFGKNTVSTVNGSRPDTDGQ
jgi:hypothetical protein